MRNDTGKPKLWGSGAGVLAALTAIGLLAACSNVEPFNYTAIHEIPEGPGLFSGSDGEFDLYSSD